MYIYHEQFPVRGIIAFVYVLIISVPVNLLIANVELAGYPYSLQHVTTTTTIRD